MDRAPLYKLKPSKCISVLSLNILYVVSCFIYVLLSLSFSLPFSCRPSCGSRCSGPAPTMKPSRQPQSTTLPSRRSSRPSTRPAWALGSKSPLSKTSSPWAPEGVKGPRDFLNPPLLLPPRPRPEKQESPLLTTSPQRHLPPSHVSARTCTLYLWK